MKNVLTATILSSIILVLGCGGQPQAPHDHEDHACCGCCEDCTCYVDCNCGCDDCFCPSSFFEEYGTEPAGTFGDPQEQVKAFGKVYKARDDQHLNKMIEYARARDMKLIVMYSLEGCGPCGLMKPHFRDAALRTPEIPFVVAMAHKCPTNTRKNTNRFPTTVMYLPSGGTRKHVGYLSTTSLESWVNR